MTKERMLVTALRLQRVDDLFERPDLTPLSPAYAPHSSGPALEFLADEIRANSSYRSVSVTFEVPASSLAGRSEASVRAAIERWAAARQLSMDRNVAAADWRGVRTLVLGFVAFAVLIALGRVVAEYDGDLADTLRRGLEVGAWVILWFPIDLLVFGRWQHRLERRTYRLLRDMEVTLRPIADAD